MRLIRKYPNRRLYDTSTGRFIKLAELRELIVAGHDIRAEDKATGEDITRSLLLQVVSEAEEQGQPILSEHLLLDLIRLHDHPMQHHMTPYLERSVNLLMQQIDQMQTQFSQLLHTGPLQAWQTYTKESLDWWSQFMPDGSSSNRQSES